MAMKTTHAAPLAGLVAAGLLVFAPPAGAQGLDSQGAIDTIVGSDVKTEEMDATAERERVAAAMDASMDNAQIVRRAFNIDEVEIVFLPAVGEGGTGITEKRQELADEILELQQAIEGSAIFYHAVNSRQILVRDIVAIEFGEENRTATIFVAGASPERTQPAAAEPAPLPAEE